MIQFLSVSKLYPNGYLALNDISFEISEGEFVFLIGPSGSGKTTIIKHLIREEAPSEGRIYFDDDDITTYKRKKVYELRRKIGVVFQDYKLVFDKNTYENVAFAMEAAGKSPKDIEETVPYVLDIVGLSGREGAFPEQLSGGEKQRVAIARAISNNPKLLIADEPTGNLDPDAAWDIVQILSKINNWGTTVLMSTHGSDIVDTLGKRVISLQDGKIKRDAIKGSYKDEDLIIAKTKIIVPSAPKEVKENNAEKKKTELTDSKTETDKQTGAITTAPIVALTDPKLKVTEVHDESKKIKEKTGSDKKVEVPPVENKNEIANEKQENKESKEIEEKPTSISLTLRQRKKQINSDYETKIQQKLERHVAKEPPVDISSDIKATNLNPKLKSILKAFGYDNIKSLHEAGYKKLSRIDELSPKDLKAIKSLLNNVKYEPSNNKESITDNKQTN